MEKNWFTIKKIFKNVYGIGEFNHFEKVVSYLVVGKDSALLFDTGLGIGDLKKEVIKLTKLPLIVINSHHHYDHVGGNNSFKQQIIQPKNGQLIKIDPFEFEVIATPGHSPDSICLYDAKKKWLLTGDTIYPGPIYLQFKESNLSSYQASIKKLNNLKVNWIFPAHNSFKTKPLIIKLLNDSLLNISLKITDPEIRLSKVVSLRFK